MIEEENATDGAIEIETVEESIEKSEEELNTTDGAFEIKTTEESMKESKEELNTTDGAFEIKTTEESIKESKEELNTTDGALDIKTTEEAVKESKEELFVPNSSMDINTQDMVLTDDAKIASSLAEFKIFLADSTTTTIYLNTDILIPIDGLPINSNKKNLIIDGKSPIDGDIHTITDYNTLEYKDTIKLENNSDLKLILVRNMVIYGKNYYGTVFIHDIVKNVVITYENVQYYGPQLTYNTNGTACYKDCNIQIGKFNGKSPAQELVEAENVIFEGNTTVTQVEETAYEIIYSALSGMVEIAEDANVTIKTYLEGGFFWGGASTNFILHKKAQFKFYGAKRFWEYIPFRNVTIKPHASLYIEITSGLAYNAMLRIDGSLNVESDGELILINRGSSLYWPINMNSGNANFMNPRRIVLYSPGIRPLYYGMKGRLSVNAQQIRYWKNAAAIPQAGGYNNIPDYHWNKLDSSNLTIDGTVAIGPIGNFISFMSNYNSANTTGSNTLSASTFNLQNARVLAFGRLPLTGEYVALNDGTSNIIGLTEPSANLQVSFVNEQSEEIILSQRADENGNFRVFINNTLTDGTVITVRSNKQFLTSEIQTIASNSRFQFHMEARDLEFETTYLSYVPQLVKRNDPNWNIVITDSRGAGSSWSLTAQLMMPLSYTNELDGITYTLDNALVFIDDSGSIHTLTTNSETPIYSHTTASEIDLTTIMWEENKGILALIQPKTAYTNIPYTGSILWILRNTP